VAGLDRLRHGPVAEEGVACVGCVGGGGSDGVCLFIDGVYCVTLASVSPRQRRWRKKKKKQKKTAMNAMSVATTKKKKKKKQKSKIWGLRMKKEKYHGEASGRSRCLQC
jgi:hypothetical protein